MLHFILDLGFPTDCDEAEASRKLAVKQQEKIVQLKERQAIRPVPGFLYKLKKEKKEDRIKLQSLGCLKVTKYVLKHLLALCKLC